MKNREFRNGCGCVMVLLAALIGCAETELTPLQLAETSFKSGDWDDAITRTTELLATTDTSTDEGFDRRLDLLLLRAKSYLGKEDFDQAITDFSTIIRSRTDDPQLYYYRQLAYEGAGEPELAEEDANMGRRLDPQYQAAYKVHPSNFGPRSELTIGSINHVSDEEDEDEDEDDHSRKSKSPADAESVAGSPMDIDPDQGVADETVPGAGGESITLPTESPAIANRIGSEALNNELGDGTDLEMRRKLLAEEEKQNSLPDVRIPQEGPSLENVPTISTPPQSLSTAIPLENNRELDTSPLANQPRPTGIQSSRPIASLPSVTGQPGLAGPRQTGIQSQTAANLTDRLPRSTAIQPGTLQGNTVFAPGAHPTISTSLPGASNPNPPIHQVARPIISTQLPPSKTIAPNTAPRATGLRAKPRS